MCNDEVTGSLRRKRLDERALLLRRRTGHGVLRRRARLDVPGLRPGRRRGVLGHRHRTGRPSRDQRRSAAATRAVPGVGRGDERLRLHDGRTTTRPSGASSPPVARSRCRRPRWPAWRGRGTTSTPRATPSASTSPTPRRASRTSRPPVGLCPSGHGICECPPCSTRSASSSPGSTPGCPRPSTSPSALIWLIPDKRLERALAETLAPRS